MSKFGRNSVSNLASNRVSNPVSNSASNFVSNSVSNLVSKPMSTSKWGLLDPQMYMTPLAFWGVGSNLGGAV